MFYPDSFRLSTPGETEILVERDFHAPRETVFRAFTEPALVRRWLLGPDGWTMPVCEIDLRPGGKYRYVWRKEATGYEMGMGGVFLEIVRPERIVATEKFDDAWYPGEALNSTVFEKRAGGGTRVKLTVRYESKEARDTASRSGMERGMAAGYDRLEALLEAEQKLENIEMPVVIETAPQSVATIHITVPRSEIRAAMQAGIEEVMTAVKTQGAGPTGPWFDHHQKMDPGIFDFEICVPVSAPVTPVGRVVNREIPSVRVVQTVYKGPYEGLGAVWQEFGGWIRANGYIEGPDLYQCFVVGPESGLDPSEWKTELRRPIAGNI